MFKKLIWNKKGQGLMEYMIITSLVGVLCLTAVKSFGESIETRIKKAKLTITSKINI